MLNSPPNLSQTHSPVKSVDHQQPQHPQLVPLLSLPSHRSHLPHSNSPSLRPISIDHQLSTLDSDYPQSFSTSSPRSSFSSNPTCLETPPIHNSLLPSPFNQDSHYTSSSPTTSTNTNTITNTHRHSISTTSNKTIHQQPERSSSICSVQHPSIRAIWNSLDPINTPSSLPHTFPTPSSVPTSIPITPQIHHQPYHPRTITELTTTQPFTELQTPFRNPFTTLHHHSAQGFFDNQKTSSRYPKLDSSSQDPSTHNMTERDREQANGSSQQEVLTPSSPSQPSVFSIDSSFASQLQSAQSFALTRVTSNDTQPSSRGSSALDDHTSSLRPTFGNRVSPIGRLSLDSVHAPSFQPSLGLLNDQLHPHHNIWAQPVNTPATSSSSGGASDFDLHSPVGTAPTRPTLMSAHLTSTQSMISSPVSLLDYPTHENYRDRLSPTHPGAFGPTSLPSTFYGPWHGNNGQGVVEEERAGRSRARDILGATRPGPIGRDPSVGSIASIGSPASSSARSGIGLSNMSPFTGTSLLPTGAGHGGIHLGSQLSSHGFRSSRIRDSSLGAIGTGRTSLRPQASTDQGFQGAFLTNSNSNDPPWFVGGRSLSNSLEEESDEDGAPPTRSGATSRRHSVAAFGSRSLLDNLNISRPTMTRMINNPKQPSPIDFTTRQMFGTGSSALTDDDLDLSSLRLEEDDDMNSGPGPSFDFHHHHQQQYHHHPTRAFHHHSTSLPWARPDRKSSFTAGDPFSSSARAAMHFASLSTQASSTNQSRFPFGQAGPGAQASNAISGPSVTTFSSNGGMLLSTRPSSNFTFDPATAPIFYPRSFAINNDNINTTTTSSSPFNLNPSIPSGTPGPGPGELSELGKGLPLSQLNPNQTKLYVLEFKGNRTDLFYNFINEETTEEEEYKLGDLVIVEADRGKDLGKIVVLNLNIEEVKSYEISQFNDPNLRLTKEIHPKRIYGKATPNDIEMLISKSIDELKALNICKSKALLRGLKMEIKSAEWQWDRRKLTFFFLADKRIDFRDLVKDLFRTWKTRIWMCSVNP